MSHLDSMPPDQQVAIKKLLAEVRAKHDKLLAELPEPVRRLGNTIRLGLKFGTTKSLLRALHNLGFHEVTKHNVERFRDILILHRHDLFDLAAAARARLRVVYLRNQPGGAMTEDFALAMHLGEGIPPRCSACQYFGHAPADEGPEAKPCIGMGAKESDQACFGFTFIRTS